MTEQREPFADELPELFSEFVGFDATERLARLHALRAARPALAARLAELLDADRDAGAFLTRPLTTPAVSAILAAGDVIEGFRIEAELGSGSNGSVYRATQDYPRRTVALKVLHFALPSVGAVVRFRREVRTLARLAHPGIVPLFAAGVIDPEHRALPWFAMELVEGARDVQTWSRDQPIDARVRVIADACDAIHHAHLKGVIHRDLKPGNVLVGADDRPRVIDFGVATSTGASGVLATHVDSLTPHGALVGTFAYLSPEQLDASGEVDARTDIYALGVVLYKMCTGRMPFDLGGTPAQTIRAIASETAMDPARAAPRERALRGDLAAIILKAIERDPARRYKSASEFGADLQHWRAGEPVTARRPRPTERVWRAAHRRPVLTTAIVLGTLGAAGVTISSIIGGALAYREAARAQRYISGLISALEAPSVAGRGRDARMADAADAIVRGVDISVLPPNEEADGRMIAGRIYELLALYPESIAQYEQAHALRVACFGTTSSEALETLSALARAVAAHRPTFTATGKYLGDADSAEGVAVAFRSLTASLGWSDPRTLDAFQWSARALRTEELRSTLRLIERGDLVRTQRVNLLSTGLRELASRGDLTEGPEDVAWLDHVVNAIESASSAARADSISIPAELAYELTRPHLRTNMRADASARRLVAGLAPDFLTDRFSRFAAKERRLLAIAVRTLGEPGKALELLEVNLRVADPSIPFGRQTLYAAGVDASQVMADLGRPSDAEALLARITSLPEPPNEDRHTIGWRACALAAYARALREAGHIEAALDWAQLAREALSRSNVAATPRIQSFTNDVEFAEHGPVRLKSSSATPSG